jgi:DNA (cytosine-5)-methyltransferase 1
MRLQPFNMAFNAIELCAGAGGQALGLESAGFHHVAAVEYEPQFCTTLRTNRPTWNVLQQDIRHFRAKEFQGVDLLAGGVPCPPFSIAGKQLGAADERDMFPTALTIIGECQPRAVMLENVPGFASEKFKDYREKLRKTLHQQGYQSEWKILQASDFGVPQLRPRFVLVALRPADAEHFFWPLPVGKPATVGEALVGLMGENGWLGAENWARRANTVAPTIVGGSKKHGGPDLGPTRAKSKWRSLGVDGLGIADEAPAAVFPFDSHPRLTLPMVARIQGFPDTWKFTGKKTAAYRQTGNAFPPPVARAVGLSIIGAFERRAKPRGHELELRLMEKSTTYKPSCQNKARKP